MNLVSGKTFQYSGGPSWEANVLHTPLKTLDREYGLSHSAWSQYVADNLDVHGDAGGLRSSDYSKINIPVLIGVGWWDDQDAMLTWQKLQQAKSATQCRLLVGAWDHLGNVAPQPVLGGLDVSASVMDTIWHIEQFLALHLKGERTALANAPRCKVFLTGEDRWDESDHWPHPQTVEKALYFASEGDALGLKGNGRLVGHPDSTGGSDTFTYDPNHPGRDLSNLERHAWSDPPLDVRYLQRRNDILVYTSRPLEQPLKVSGRYRAHLFVSSDRPDTDLFINLTDVHPDGRAVTLAATNMPAPCLRLRYRNGPEAELLEPDVIYDVTVQGSWMHHVFRVGHRLRITVSSSNFPHAARNAGTGEHWAKDEVLYPQTNVIYHSSDYPSQVRLPVVCE
jgi:putative CocE/NonD family hydrolase